MYRGNITHSKAGHYIASVRNSTRDRVWKSHKLSTLDEARRQLSEKLSELNSQCAVPPL